MKSLILKDIYNIKHNSKLMVVMLIFMGVCFIPSGGVEAFIVACALVGSMMIITTFSFDENCKWDKYAMVMPVSRKDYVLAKYLTNLMLGGAGLLFGLAVALAAGIISGKMDMSLILICAILGALFVVLGGSLFIPMIIRFGAENARLVMMGGVGIPAIVIFLIYKIIETKHIVFTEQMVLFLLIAGIILFAALVVISFKLSVKWFMNKEF